jgi:DNA-binding LytR/AlgR family response regulator
VICGYGPVGRDLAAELANQGMPAMTIDLNTDEIRKLQSDGQHALFADANQIEVWPDREGYAIAKESDPKSVEKGKIIAQRNYSRVTTRDAKHLTARQTIRQWAARLPPGSFAQLDRGLIVNLHRIRAADFSVRAAVVTLGDHAQELRLGAAAAARLREMLPP